MSVNAGDVIIGDENGIVVVAQEAIESVLAALVDVKAKEQMMDELVAKGAKSPPGMEQLLAEKGVRYLD
jgi:regulator of RNase E activity RraA